MRGNDGRFVTHLPHDNDFFEVIDSEDKAYWLGFLFGDGWIDKNRNQLSCESIDIEHMERLHNTVGGSSTINYRNRSLERGKENCRQTAVFGIYDRKIVSDIKKLGMIQGGEKSKIGFVRINLIPKQLHRHFWRGLTDADGYVKAYSQKSYRNGKGISRIEIKNSKAHIDLLYYEWKKLGFNGIPKSYEYKTKTKGMQTQWYIVTAGDQICKRIAEWLYSDCSVKLNRKYTEAIEMLGKEAIHRKYDHLGKEELLRLKQEYETWEGVRGHLGISKTAMYNTRKRLGLEIGVNKHEYKLELIEELYEELGTRQKVADKLGISINSLYGIIKRLKHTD